MSEALVERYVTVSSRDHRMLGWSVGAHLTLLVVIAVGPTSWLGPRTQGALERVITLDISGMIGPYNGGLTSAAARPVQDQRGLPQELVRQARPAPAAQPRAVRPASREETRASDVAASPGVQADGTSLTTGSGGGSGAQLDAGDFCCPEYIVTMQHLINQHWMSKQESAGMTVMKFTIQRDGRLTDIVREKPSGQPTLDFLSERALMLTKQLPPLPAAYSQPTLTVHLTFEYYR